MVHGAARRAGAAGPQVRRAARARSGLVPRHGCARDYPHQLSGGHAATGDARDGAGQPAAGAHRRRADDRARRDHPGADPRAPRRAPTRAWARPRARHPRPRRRRRARRPGRGDVRGPRRRRRRRSTSCSPRSGHPYTRGLLASVPRHRRRPRRLAAIPGSPPDPAALPPGCAFHPRCPIAEDRCRTTVPGCAGSRDGHRGRVSLRRRGVVPGTPDDRGDERAARGRRAGQALPGARGGVGARGRRRDVHARARARPSGWWGSRGAASRRWPAWWSGCSNPPRASIRVDGDDVANLSRRRLRALRRRVQIVFQDPYVVARPADDRRVRSSPSRSASPGAAARSRARVPELFGARRARRRARSALPARALRRATSARRHRPRARARTRAARARRAGHRARRVDPGADPQPARRPAGAARPRVPVHRARPRGGAPHGRSRRGDAPRQDRRDRDRAELFAAPAHPYTQALLSAVPVPDPAQRTRPPAHRARAASSRARRSPPSGCRFRTRCWKATDDCARGPGPELVDRGQGHPVACLFPEPPPEHPRSRAVHVDRQFREARRATPVDGAVPRYHLVHSPSCGISPVDRSRGTASLHCSPSSEWRNRQTR